MVADDPKAKEESGEIKQTLIILKSKATSLKSAENFLRNRSCDVHSTTEVKTALPAILLGKATYVLLTVEHPNQKVMKLPALIKQTLKNPIIFFAEGLSAQGPATLNELKYPYVIYPPVSGPSIERMILRIERELKLASEEHSVAPVPDYSLGREPTERDSVYRDKNEAQQEIARMFADDSGGEDLEFFSHQKGNSTAHSGVQGSDVGSTARRIKPTVGKSIIVGLDKPKPTVTEASSKINSTLSDPAAKTIVLPGRGSGTGDSILIQGAQHAVESAVKSPDQAEHRLGRSTKLHCFYVESEKFHGYVLVAYAESKELEKKFKEDLRKTFLHFVRTSGVKIEIQDTSDISILEVDFEEWSLAESEFLVKSIHAGAEVAVTFMPTEKGYQSIETTEDGKMLSVSLEEIEVEVALEFDLFLYMPTNNRYFHYTKKNGRLSQIQKDRLIDSKRSQLHVKLDAREKVNAYRTTRFLNEKIRKHQSRKAS